MPLLYFWRWDNYQRDLNYGVGYHLNQKAARLHSIELGDSLWAFTRRPCDGAYVLVAELVAKAKTINHPRLAKEYRYGPYRLWGDLTRSRYFAAEGQAPIDPLVRALSLEVRTHSIGRSFQGPGAVRTLTAADHAMLTQAAASTKREPRARLAHEDIFEAMATSGNPEEVRRLLAADAPDLAKDRVAYLYGPAIARTRTLTRDLRTRYQDRCQLCGWSAGNSYGEAVCEAHHLHWLSRGGADRFENLVLLCPNHHRVVHRTDAVFDYRDLCFVFTAHHREVLREPGHLVG